MVIKSFKLNHQQNIYTPNNQTGPIARLVQWLAHSETVVVEQTSMDLYKI